MLLLEENRKNRKKNRYFNKSEPCLHEVLLRLHTELTGKRLERFGFQNTVRSIAKYALRYKKNTETTERLRFRFARA